MLHKNADQALVGPRTRSLYNGLDRKSAQVVVQLRARVVSIPVLLPLMLGSQITVKGAQGSIPFGISGAVFALGS